MVWSGLILGMLLGFVIQRGRFCTVALVRESVLRRPIALYMVGIIITIHAVGVQMLASSGLMQIEEVYFQPISAVAGGLLFGCGMMLAGFCPATLWVRTGEGIIAAWVALLFFMIGVEFAKGGVFKPLYLILREYEKEPSFIHQTLDISPWWLAGGLALVCIIWLVRELSRPAVKPYTMPPEYSGLRHILFEARWHPAVTAALFGIILVAAWPLAMATGRTAGVAFSGPSGNLLSFIIAGKPSIHWGIMFVVGVASGGFLAASGAGEFRLRNSDPKAILRGIAGGFAMGVGSAVASGCIISHCLINSSMFAWQGVVSGAAIIIGASITALFIYKKK